MNSIFKTCMGFFIISFTGLLPSLSCAQLKKHNVIISQFNSPNEIEFKTLAEAIPDILSVCFSDNSDVISVLDRSILGEQDAITYSSFQDINSTHDPASYLVSGTISPSEKGVMLTLMLTNISTTKVITQSIVEGKKEDFVSLSCDAAKYLLENLSGSLTDNAPYHSVSIKASQYSMLRALSYYYNGAYEQAIAEFMKIIKKDSTDADAAFWLAKTYQKAGLKEEAALEFLLFKKNFPSDKRTIRADSSEDISK